ncbi:MAG TPA: uroporphyrinogen-III synthase [Ideonella sp.]|uniref:uroporphyrinogen-III synthase n=1 Tax=Ideonella sp. TaxID=1929293 RepID=UPI002BB69AB6|nr:uroporphyrinogen-III synthase [Ideonella sp.]HSI47279.1 uroporphyrinogen-III synthase [Ideonella sp.]
MSQPGRAVCRVLVTRPEPQASEWVAQLRGHQVQAEALPLMGIAGAPAPARVREVFAGLHGGALLMFVSPNAALQFFACLPPGASWPAGVQAAATGPGTVAALRAAGVPAGAITAPDEAAAQFDSEALWEQLRAQDWQGRPVWVVRGDGGRDWFAATLAQAGAEVGFVQSYARLAPDWSPAQLAVAHQALAEPAHARWLLSSSEGIEHLARLLPQADWAKAVALASHPRIEARALALGFGTVLPVRPGWRAVVAQVLA